MSLDEEISQTNALAYYKRMLNMENSLKWIRHQAVLHYYGDAFDPEHMRYIANAAADAISWNTQNDEMCLPVYDIAIEEAKLKAQQEADELWESLGVVDDNDDNSTHST